MVPENSDVKLNCIFELNGFQLYSVKWYKDQTEFYSFVPRENPPIQTFRTEGIKVDLTRSKIGSVYIRNVKQSSEGTYKCELSGESPYFPLEYKTRIMKVYLAPKHAPIISGYANSYKVGDYVSVNCTSDRSKPGVHLKWYVGDSFLNYRFISIDDDDDDDDDDGDVDEGDVLGMQSRMLQYVSSVSNESIAIKSVSILKFKIKQEHMRSGQISLKCISSFANSENISMKIQNQFHLKTSINIPDANWPVISKEPLREDDYPSIDGTDAASLTADEFEL
ncbi:Cell adhesion molecule 3 [Nymphon striatum]|nr:Cell adhesion molecule 3 [Nymphon striatum]